MVVWTWLPCVTQFVSQNSTTVGTYGEEKQAATERDVETDHREGPEEQKADPGACPPPPNPPPKAAADRARWRSLAVTSLGQTAQRGLTE